MVLALFLAAFAIFLAALFLSGGILIAAGAFALAGGFLMARAILGASAILAVGSEADTVGASHLAVFHALMLFGLLASGLLITSNRVIVVGVAVAGHHCKCESDSKESRN